MQSVLFVIIKCTVWFVRVLPASFALAVGRFCGFIMYCCDKRHRLLAYQNFKMAFASERSLKEIRSLVRAYFMNLGANFVEFLRLPLRNPEEIYKHIQCDGFEHIHEAMRKGKGAVVMTMHYGNWELSTLALSLCGYDQNVIFKVQESATAFNKVMMACRKDAYAGFGGINVFERGIGARQLINALKNNEIVGMLADQGGKEGIPVKFFGRWARFSIGGVRLALKIGASICIGAIRREKGSHHRLSFYKFDPVRESEDEKENIAASLQKVANVIENIIRECPEQHMWMYKIWKYDQSKNIMILNDGRVGHLRQSQAVSHIIKKEIERRENAAHEQIVDIKYRGKFSKYMVLSGALLGWLLPGVCKLGILKRHLVAESFEMLCRMKADIVVSAGSYSAAVNYLIADEHQAKSISLLRPGILPLKSFDLVILPEHDKPKSLKQCQDLVFTKGAPNLIDDVYLSEYAGLLQQRYSHLKLRDKFIIGILLGGDTKDYILDENLAKILVHQVKEVAEQLNADILITTSRRTSEKVEGVFVREFKKYSRCQLLVVANRNNIPEAVGGILGLSDILVVTGDSISMVSEAASSGKKTVVVPVKRRAGQPQDHKHNRFVDRLTSEGYILCSDPKMIKQSIFNLAKNKIYTRKLNDTEVLREGISKIL